MIKKSLLSLAFFLAAGVASASPLCTDPSLVTLQDLINLGAGGCNLGSTLFANFAYSYTPAGGASNVTASQVTITVTPGIDRFQFVANWVAFTGQSGSGSITFTVSDPAGFINSLQNIYTSNSVPINGAGTSHTFTSTCTGGSCGAPTNFLNTTVGIPFTHGPLSISNTFSIAGGTGTLYHLSNISDSFAVLTPEPSSVFLAVGGLGMLAFLRRRRS
jgi:MYXO-CTERM domain-containing protein